MSAIYKFYKKCDIQRSGRSGGCVAHMKYTLADKNDEDVVACLIVRQHIRQDLPANELEDMVHGHGRAIEPALRKIVEDRLLFENPNQDT